MPSSRSITTIGFDADDTLWFSEGNRLDYKPVQLKPLTAESVPPKERTF